MKNLVLGSLIALASTQAAGCIIESNGSEDAYITANWTFKNATNNTTTSCPSGFDTVALYNQEVASDFRTPIGPPIIDLFDCAAGSGTSAPLPPTLFLSWIEVTDHNNTSKYATSTSAFVDVTVSDKSFSAQILNDGGYFEFAWNLYGASSDLDLTCAEAGASGGVESLATDVSDGSNSATDQFDCEDGSAITAGFRSGNYTIQINALNSAELSIGAAPLLENKPIGIKNSVTPLGTIEIPIDGL